MPCRGFKCTGTDLLVEGHCHVENKTEHSSCPSIGVNGNKHVILAVLEMKKNESVKKNDGSQERGMDKKYMNIKYKCI